MSAEIELKLLVNPAFAAFLSKEMASFKVLSHTQQVLGNCYYDTADYFFSSQRMGLRVRTLNDQFILTLKTDGTTIGGLHMRPEYNCALDDASPRLNGLNQFADLQLSRPLEQLQQHLKPIFSTDFLRQAWEIELGNGANIEVALDQGEIEAQERFEPIYEAEFELKHGSLDDLLTFVESLSLSDGIRLGSASKAKRGYRLAGIAALQAFEWQHQWQQLLSDLSLAATASAALSRLFAYEQSLTEYYAELLTMPLSAAQLDSALQAFMTLYRYYDQHQSLLWRAYQQQVGQRLKVRLDQDSIEELIELNQRFLAKLTELSKLSDDENRTLRLHEFLHRGNGVKRQIYLIKLTLNG
ncbi:CYTH domain-containing protein [Testudinibacter sp. TR-2022]|uniref:CYTH domain-containing protein n=1 Tax=Testudinibacter sp. TR-2022 TaxID=2585029 RepID=UPI001117F428|nr:CYTH domain-containing protein [Testudinibacter sp. TR-2022]TNH06283.1 CYTH domain-containing protein [Pasteurellaceae bacterium Phil11]TNH23054.1 CYTH domain-containing protein [Testudinibacter sp. TR-2022]TNH26738.1 CYTH domain-containing protein [Testudinibacter sp. TR-2022]